MFSNSLFFLCCEYSVVVSPFLSHINIHLFSYISCYKAIYRYIILLDYRHHSLLVHYISAQHQCIALVHSISVLRQCIVLVYYISTLHQCIALVHYISALHQCIILVHCISALCQCNIQVRCITNYVGYLHLLVENQVQQLLLG